MAFNERFAELWSYLELHSHELMMSWAPEEVLKGLDSRVRAAADLGWELGPLPDGSVFLALSPGGDRALMRLVKDAVDLAPDLDGLKVVAGRPARDWGFVIKVRGAGDVLHEVDCSKWRYALEAFPDGKIGMEVAHEGSLDGAMDFPALVHLALDLELGEQFRVGRFEYVGCFERLSEGVLGGGSGFKYIAEHLSNVDLL